MIIDFYLLQPNFDETKLDRRDSNPHFQPHLILNQLNLQESNQSNQSLKATEFQRLRFNDYGGRNNHVDYEDVKSMNRDPNESMQSSTYNSMLQSSA